MIFDFSLLSVYKTKNVHLRTSFEHVKDFVNYGIKNNLYPYIPRRTLVTDDEIDTLWLANFDKNMTYHASYAGQIVGSATIFGDPNSSAYKCSYKRKPSALGMMVDESFQHSDIVEFELIKKLVSDNLSFYDIIPIEDKSLIKSFRNFDFEEFKINDSRFKDIGLSGDCIKFIRHL